MVLTDARIGDSFSTQNSYRNIT